MSVSKSLVAIAVAFVAGGSPAKAAVGAPAPEGGCLAKLSHDQRQFEQDLGRDLRLIFRGRNGVDVFYLTSGRDAVDHCGARGSRTIFATIRLDPNSGRSMASFDCHDPRHRLKKGDAIVASFDADGKAARGWLANRSAKTFSPVDNVSCRFDD